MKAAALSIALVACGAGQAPPLSNQAAGPVAADTRVEPATGGAAVLARLEQLADQMCRCPDRDCADQVIDAMTRWADELASIGAATPKVTSAQSARVEAVTGRITRCMSDVYRRRATILAP